MKLISLIIIFLLLLNNIAFANYVEIENINGTKYRYYNVTFIKYENNIITILIENKGTFQRIIYHNILEVKTIIIKESQENNGEQNDRV